MHLNEQVSSRTECTEAVYRNESSVAFNCRISRLRIFIPRCTTNRLCYVFNGTHLNRSKSDIRGQLTFPTMAPSTAEDASRRIYMIGGVGSVGKLIAHSLRDIQDPPPITHLLHVYSLVKQWEDSKKVITIQRDGKELEQSGFDVELMPKVSHAGAKPDTSGEGSHAISDAPIKHLLVITKAAYTVPNLVRVAHRLGPDSTICFLQNGMGIIDEVNEKIFSDPKTRPNYMQGIITHGMNTPPEIMARDPFYAVHGGQGTISIGLLPRGKLSKEEITEQGKNPKALKEDQWPASAQYLFKTLLSSPVIAAQGITATELLQQQLEKLAVNAVINPLTAVLGGPNGTIIEFGPLRATIDLLLGEITKVFTSLPELQGVPDIDKRFSEEKLMGGVTKQCVGTPHNISSMLSDIKIGQQTEIGYINGYIVRRGKELGIEATVNYAIMQTVITKQQMVEKEKREGAKL